MGGANTKWTIELMKYLFGNQEQAQLIFNEITFFKGQFFTDNDESGKSLKEKMFNNN